MQLRRVVVGCLAILLLLLGPKPVFHRLAGEPQLRAVVAQVWALPGESRSLRPAPDPGGDADASGLLAEGLALAGPAPAGRRATQLPWPAAGWIGRPPVRPASQGPPHLG